MFSTNAFMQDERSIVSSIFYSMKGEDVFSVLKEGFVYKNNEFNWKIDCKFFLKIVYEEGKSKFFDSVFVVKNKSNVKANFLA